MIKKALWPLTASLLISFLLSMSFLLGVFSLWQERLSDSLFTPKDPNPNIVIIAIDDLSLSEIGRWPWSRQEHAKLIQLLNNQDIKPKKIGLDISFFEPSDTNSDNELAQAIRQYGNVVLAAETKDGQVLEPIGVLKEGSQIGLVNTIVDSDGITRKFLPQTIFSNGKTQESFALKLSGEYLPSHIDYTSPLRINFIGKPGKFPSYSYVDVARRKVDPKVFADKIVIIGATAQDLHDTQIVPTSSGSPMPGAEIHANTVQTILDGRYLLNESKVSTILNIFALSLFLSLILVNLRVRNGAISTVVLLFLYIIYVIYSFDAGTVRNLVYPPLSIILSLVSSIIYKYLTETKQKRFLRHAFSKYVSEDIVNEIVNHPEKLKLGGERKNVTVLFSDIEGFTSISEKLDPEKLTENLNNYLNEITSIILKNKGVVDKFIGDSVMAFWGAPLEDEDHAMHACIAALEMKKVSVGKFKSRIGINTGGVVIGNMGSKDRFDYTVLGDTVNIASRLEGLNKEYKTKILISESTYRQVKDHIKAKKIGTVTVRGKTKPLDVYELLDIYAS